MSIDAIGDRYDVIIAGARASGASTAMLLARHGLNVLVVDPARPGSDALSTHALMRGAVLQLHRWGLLGDVKDAGTPDIRSTTFHYGDDSVQVTISPRDGVDALYAPRRTVLDPILVRGARASGALVVHGVKVVDLLWTPGGRVQGAVVADAAGEVRQVRSEMIIGADGVRSRVARLVRAPIDRGMPNATASIYGYTRELAVDGYQWLYRPGLGAGAIPTNSGETCVFLSMPSVDFHEQVKEGLQSVFARALRSVAPDLSAPVLAAPPLKLRAFPGLPGFLRRSAGPGWALVGDAGYFRDPLTAHGITDALRDAEFLAEAVATGSTSVLAGYQATRDRIVRQFLELTDRIASFEWDLAEIKDLHLALSRAMSAQVDELKAFAGPAGDRPLPVTRTA